MASRIRKAESSMCEWVLTHLAPLEAEARAMFGGYGIYADEQMFGIVHKERCFFKVNDETRARYEAAGSEAFRPYKDQKKVMRSYYEVPADVLDDPGELLRWAAISLDVAKGER